MNQKVLSTLKSSETDDWVDIKVVRPLAYLWARFFAKLGVHPNTVTIISMVIGAAAAFFFMRGSYFYEGTSGLWSNIIAILLLLWADVYDCTDGQLARMTGKTSRIGRILDGLAGAVWYIPLYILIIVRLYHYHSIEFGWLGIDDTQMNITIATVVAAILANISGFICCAGQQRVADYYIQIHLFFLKGEKGCELENSANLRKTYNETRAAGNRCWRIFLRNYITYTRLQEKRTPEFQKLMKQLKEKFGSYDNIPAEIRTQFHDRSLSLMPVNGLLTFNFRTTFLALFCLFDMPFEYLLFETIVMTLMCNYIVHRHETFCRHIRESL